MKSNEHYIEGVSLLQLESHQDDRGSLTEFYRESWVANLGIKQWNLVQTSANTLRGLHVHHAHTDYLIVVSGEMQLGLKDIREDSSSADRFDVLSLKGVSPEVVKIPPGVGHLFYFPVDSIFVYGVSEYWDPSDEMGCRWDDPDLDFRITEGDPLVSVRDERAGSLTEMREDYLSALDRGMRG